MSKLKIREQKIKRCVLDRIVLLDLTSEGSLMPRMKSSEKLLQILRVAAASITTHSLKD